MFKRRYILAATSLVVLFGLAAAIISIRGKSPVGYWHGDVVSKYGKWRIGLVVEKLLDGTFSARTLGLDDDYGRTLNSVVVTSKVFQAGYELTSTIDLKMDWTGRRLSGIWKGEHETYSIELTRGMNYFLPRTDGMGDPVTDYRYEIPEKSSDGWDSADIQSVGGNPKKIEEGVRQILQLGDFNIHSLVVVRHGKLVLDEYFYGYGPEDEHPLASVTKSVLSTLFGIADDQGWLKPEQKLYDFFPGYRSKPGWQADKDKITLGMLLSMTSGVDCADWAPPRNACTAEMVKTPDWNEFSLTQPLGHVPGKHFAYCSSCLNPLSVLLAEKSRMPLPDFADKYLYGPLGIQARRWYIGPHDLAMVSGGHWLRPRDMAKLGLLYLNKGIWNGKQIVSSHWVEEATSIKAVKDEPRDFDYGYLWWSKQVAFAGRQTKVFYAAGLGGQFIIVAPELDLVCVLTGGNYKLNEEGGQAFGIFTDYVLGAFNPLLKLIKEPV